MLKYQGHGISVKVVSAEMLIVGLLSMETHSFLFTEIGDKQCCFGVASDVLLAL